MYLHELLTDLREGRNQSQRALARDLGMSPVTVNSLEHGKFIPRLSTLVEVGRALGFEVALHCPDRSFIVIAEQDELRIEPVRSSGATAHQRLKALDGLTPEQIEIVAQVARLVRPVAA